MQEHLLSPYQSIQCTPQAEYGLDKQVFKNWDPYVNRPMTLYEAIATSCDTYFYDVGYRFYTGGRDSVGPAAGLGARVRLRRPGGARHRRRGRRARADAGLAQAHVHERLGSRVEPGRLHPARDRAEGRHRDASADGALLRDDRQRRQARHAVPRVRGRDARLERAEPGRAAPVRTRPAARRGSRPGGAAGRARGPLLGHALARRHVLRGLRRLPDLDRGQDRHRREGRAAARATRPITSRTRPGGAGTGRTTTRASSSAP